jgi:hypothetical protein
MQIITTNFELNNNNFINNYSFDLLNDFNIEPMNDNVINNNVNHNQMQNHNANQNNVYNDNINNQNNANNNQINQQYIMNENDIMNDINMNNQNNLINRNNNIIQSSDIDSTNIIDNQQNTYALRERKAINYNESIMFAINNAKDDFDLNAVLMINDNDIANNDDKQLTYNDVINSNEKQHWINAMNDEMKSLIDNETWTLTEINKNDNVNIMGCKWIFKKKLKSDGTIERYKARLVAQGYSQIYGVDYVETFAPVLKYKSLKILISIAAVYDLELKQFDVQTAFLNAPINEIVYMKQPHGYHSGPANIVCKLNKTLYGTKQAPHQWNEEINKFIVSIGFNRLVSDTCVYIKQSLNNKSVIIGLFVDDLIVLYDKIDESEYQNIKSKLFNKYKMKDLGNAEWILGMRIIRNRSNKLIHLNQELYINKMLEKFNMKHCKSLNTPAELTKLSLKDCPVNEQQKQSMLNKPYRQLVGSLLYAAISTRPDIMYAVNALSRFNNNPGELHWIAAKRVLRYLNGTVSHGILFNGNIDLKFENGLNYKMKNVNDNESNINNNVEYNCLTGYCDSDWGGDIDDRKSTSGYTIMLNNNLISWNSKRQRTIAQSSAESEYYAITEVVNELKWISMLLNELKIELIKPISIYCDNQSAIAISENDVLHNRSKHIDIKHHFIGHEIKHKVIQLKYIKSSEQLADIMTKSIGKVQFTYIRDKLMNDKSTTKQQKHHFDIK